MQTRNSRKTSGFSILAINPGSTSTKAAVFLDDKELRSQTLHHEAADLKGLRLLEQLPVRMGAVNEFVAAESRIDAIVARGGLLQPLKSGPWSINDDMLRDLREERYGRHASNLGAFMASELSSRYGDIPLMVVDPVVVDELSDVARLSGLPEIERRSIFHALNQKAVARRAANDLGISYSDARFVVVHMGGGISVGAHEGGKVVDVNNALDGEGPMAPERSGSLPAIQLAGMCYREGATLEYVYKKIVGEGGVVAHLGTNDIRKVRQDARTDKHARLVLDAMLYQIQKEIGRAVVVLKGRLDAIVLTGGMAHSDEMCDAIRAGVGRFAKVIIYPGEDELLALAQGALRVLRGEEQVSLYKRREP